MYRGLAEYTELNKIVNENYSTKIRLLCVNSENKRQPPDVGI